MRHWRAALDPLQKTLARALQGFLGGRQEPGLQLRPQGTPPHSPREKQPGDAASPGWPTPTSSRGVSTPGVLRTRQQRFLASPGPRERRPALTSLRSKPRRGSVRPPGKAVALQRRGGCGCLWGTDPRSLGTGGGEAFPGVSEEPLKTMLGAGRRVQGGLPGGPWPRALSIALALASSCSVCHQQPLWGTFAKHLLLT